MYNVTEREREQEFSVLQCNIRVDQRKKASITNHGSNDSKETLWKHRTKPTTLKN